MAATPRIWGPVSQVIICLAYEHFFKKGIHDKDHCNAFLITFKQRGYYQVGYGKWELILKANWISWANCKVKWKKEHLYTKQSVGNI